MHGTAFMTRRLFYFRDIFGFLNHAVKLHQPAILVDNFASPEENGNLATVAIFNEPTNVFELGLKVMFVRFGANLDFFD